MDGETREAVERIRRDIQQAESAGVRTDIAHYADLRTLCDALERVERERDEATEGESVRAQERNAALERAERAEEALRRLREWAVKASDEADRYGFRLPTTPGEDTEAQPTPEEIDREARALRDAVDEATRGMEGAGGAIRSAPRVLGPAASYPMTMRVREVRDMRQPGVDPDAQKLVDDMVNAKVRGTAASHALAQVCDQCGADLPGICDDCLSAVGDAAMERLRGRRRKLAHHHGCEGGACVPSCVHYLVEED